MCSSDLDTVTVANRVDDKGLEFAITSTVSFWLPETGLTVSHGTLDTILQEEFDKITNDEELPSPEATVSSEGETDNSAATPDCVTVICFADTPLPDMVTVAERFDVNELAVADTSTLLFPIPVTGDTVSHV